MQFNRKFPDVPVAVGEERMEAIAQLLHDKPETQVIVLDDAFQHRSIKAGFNILLTDCGNLYTRDFFLPTGDLRDSRKSSRRADVILITKCNADISIEEKNELMEEIHPLPHQHIFFTTIVYGTPFHITQQNFTFIDDQTEVLLITGVANPRPLKKFLEERIHTYHMMHYSDHHIFSIDDWKEIIKRFEQIQAHKKIILTTEKDAMRLLKFDNELHHLPMYVIPIEHRFLFNEGRMFDDTVINFIHNFKQPE
jgi:tetraacyldisaccharide 4'-kinase